MKALQYSALTLWVVMIGCIVSKTFAAAILVVAITAALAWTLVLRKANSDPEHPLYPVMRASRVKLLSRRNY